MNITNCILIGDALTMLRTLPDNHVQTVVTSPPYYSLRDYGVDGQIGLESSPDEFIAKLVEVFREVKRVLHPSGTAWINIGDSYAANRAYQVNDNKWGDVGNHKGSIVPPGLKPKDLIGIPWLLAFALRADGWYLRMDCIWHKPNCMPESVQDRPTKSHEYLFLLSKSERYYYDAQAIAEPMAEKSAERYKYMFGGSKSITLTEAEKYGAGTRTHPIGTREITSCRNKRSVWTISTQSFSEAHFATMPPKLVEPCILAGSSPKACEHCGAPWERITERVSFGKAESNTAYTDDTMKPTRLSGSRQAYRAMGLEGPPAPITTGWQPTCSCSNQGTGKSIVLDPFCGAGTTLMVASQLGRNWLGIELSPEYVTLAKKRIATIQPNLWETTA